MTRRLNDIFLFQFPFCFFFCFKFFLTLISYLNDIISRLNDIFVFLVLLSFSCFSFSSDK